MLEIGVVTATHPGRQPAMLGRASRSVWKQIHQPAGHFVVNDVERKGAAWTRQAALEANPFAWTAFLDSDDWFDIQHLLRCAQVAEETGADYVYPWYTVAYGEVNQETYNVQDPVFPPGHFLDPWDPANPRQTTITVLVRTDLAREVGFYDPDGGTGADGQRMGEDWEFTLGCNRLGKIVHFAERTWFWHHHGRNSSGVPGRGDAA